MQILHNLSQTAGEELYDLDHGQSVDDLSDLSEVCK